MRTQNQNRNERLAALRRRALRLRRGLEHNPRNRRADDEFAFDAPEFGPGLDEEVVDEDQVDFGDEAGGCACADDALAQIREIVCGGGAEPEMLPEELPAEPEAEKEDEKEEEKEDEKEAEEKEARVARFRAILAKRRAAKAAKPVEKKAEPVVAPVVAPVVEEKPAETKVAEPVVEEKKDEVKVDEKVEKADDKPAETKAAEVEATKTEKMWAPLMTETQADALENPQIDLALHNADTDDPNYIVTIAGRPFAEIRRSDLNLNPDTQDLFIDESFARGVKETVAHFGLVKALKDLNVRFYAAETTPDEMAKLVKAEVVKDTEAAYQKRLAALKDSLINTMNLAFTASHKNFILANPLKDALVENFRKAGLQESTSIDLIEDAFQKSGGEYFNSIMNKAEEWLGYEPEALNQIQAEVTAMQYVHPLDRMAIQDEEIQIADPTERAAATQAPDIDVDTQAARKTLRKKLR